jgi:muramoyltetrapeptide carboxypeptidase
LAPSPRRGLIEKGATVGVVATGFAVRRDDLASGVRALERLGYRPRLGEHVLAREGYLAGTDEQRVEDLNRMLRDPGVAAVWFARGGYGTARLLDRIDWRALRRAPKPLLGYSDLTALFARASAIGAPCIHAPVVTELGDPGAYHAPSLRALLRGERVTVRFRRGQVLRAGRARGRLVGGNLAVLASLLGTRHAADLRDAVLFLEEAGEETYRIDRLLTQLRATRRLDRLRGVLLGAFVVSPRSKFPPDRDPAAVLAETFAPLGVPVVTGLPVGHVRRKRSLPLGAVAAIDTAARRVALGPPA